jgi:hypothetical protein
MNLNKVLDLVATNLNIDKSILLNVIKDKIDLNKEIHDVDTINKLIDVDSKINNFEKNNIVHDHTKHNFTKLKNNLGKMQILVLISKLKKSTNCDDIINTLLNVLNNKFENINNILKSDFSQNGGSNNKYYNKYLKYKIKYLKILLK